ncbi:MAG: ROK family protein, partial [Microcystaceae cyanobacterium]
MNQPEIIGIDLGGTAIKLGRFLKNGTCLDSLMIPTPQPSSPEAVLEKIVMAVTQLNAEGHCIALGVG